MHLDNLEAVQRWAGDSESWLTGFLESLSSNRSVLAAVAMGSAVRERGHRCSDFDLLLIYRGLRPTVNSPIEVDIRYVPIDGIDEKISSGHEIICWALKFGVPVYDPECIWHRLQRNWSDHVPLPSAVEANSRGRKSLERAKEMLGIGDESAADDLLLTAVTQFARERLIKNGVFPASRPELPSQLRAIDKNDSISDLLEIAMFQDSSPSALLRDILDLRI